MTREHSSVSRISSTTDTSLRHALDRRHLLGWVTGLGVTAAAARIGLGAAQPAVARRQDAAPPSTGHTWLIDSPDALRPAAPGAPTDTEVDELLGFQADRTDETVTQIERWSGRHAVFPWLELGMRLTAENLPPGLYGLRAQSLIRTAMNDAVVAALDAQAAHTRPVPATADDRIEPVGSGSASSFPSLHAAVAGAASTVLAYLFPDASDDGFAGMANEAAITRLWAGASYRSDIEAGLALGQRVGELAVAHGEADGSDAEWDGSGWPTRDGVYEPTPPNFAEPFLPLGGTWATWVLPSGDAIRPAPFPAYGTLGWEAELAAVQRATEQRTPAQERIIDYWLSVGPDGFYTSYAQDLIERERLDEAEAASVLAMVSVAMYDGAVATWDGKYHYWVARPLTMDPSLDLYIPNPPYPSYPAGFPNACGAGAAVLADVFPAREADLLATASEGAAQRHWSGIHYVLDNDVGLQMGSQAARRTIEVVRGSGNAGDG